MMLPNGWKKVRLSELGTFSKGSGIKRDEANSGSIPAIRYGEIYTAHNDYIKQFQSFISENVAKEATLLKNGDLLFSCSGETKEDIGKCVAFVSNERAYAGGDIIILSPTVPCDSKYMGFLCNSSFVNKQRYSFAQGDSIVHISSESIGKIEIPFPPLNEQKKIAAMLSVWDSAIEKMEKLIEAKEISFNSLLKELIYAPAEKECWNIVKLGDVSEMSSGGTPKSSVEKYYNGDVLWVSIADMTEQGMYIKDTAKKLTKLGVENSAAKIYPKGTVLYAMYASIGEVSIAEKEMASSQAILGIQVSDKLVNKYLYYFLVGQKERIKLQGQAGTQSNLNAGMVKNLDIPVPSIKEQNKIIAVLDNGMGELSLLKQQLENYKKQKQGLMQKLLTGQWRVK